MRTSGRTAGRQAESHHGSMDTLQGPVCAQLGLNSFVRSVIRHSAITPEYSQRLPSSVFHFELAAGDNEYDSCSSWQACRT